MTIYGYTRVSTGRQVDSGLGLHAQRQRILDYARAHIGRQRPRIHVERGVSASKVAFARRPHGRAVDEAATAGDHIVIAKLDRGFRSTRDCATMLDRWDKRGVIVHLLDVGAATNTPAGRLIINIMAAIAEWESRRIGERIREAHAVIRAQGCYVGLPPLGFRVVRRRLVANHPLRRSIGLIVRLRESRRHPPVTFAAIAAWLTVHRCAGYPWTAKRCWRASRSPHAIRWARGVSLPTRWDPPVGYRHSAGDLKRQARMLVQPSRRRYIAHLGAARIDRRRQSRP